MTIQPIPSTPTPATTPPTAPAAEHGPAFARTLQQAEVTAARPAPVPPGVVVGQMATQGLPSLPRFMLLARQEQTSRTAYTAEPSLTAWQTTPQTTLTAARAAASNFTVPVRFTPSWVVEEETSPAPQPAPTAGTPLTLAQYPRPAADNGRGIHWIPSLRSEPAAVDRFVAEAKDMGIRWVTFLNDGTNTGDNDYLVQQLRAAGIMPVMRVYTLDGASLEGDVQAMVRHYKALGVSYFQLYNEPNLRVENQGREPDVARYVDQWTAAAREVAAAGGLPGIGGLSPQGDVDDVAFFRAVLQEIEARGETHLLDTAWISAHNYGRDALRVREYDRIAQEELGRSLPVIGTEAGFYAEGSVSEAEQTQVVTAAYDYMRRREPYYFAYTYWVIANEAGGGRDVRWNHQALFRPDGHSSIVDWLRTNAA